MELISLKAHGPNVGRVEDSRACLPNSGYTVSGEQLATEQDTVIFFSMRRIFNGLKIKKELMSVHKSQEQTRFQRELFCNEPERKKDRKCIEDREVQ